MFKNRAEAGKRLVKLLKPYRAENSVLCAIPRGGVMVAEPIAHDWKLPIRLLVVKKIVHPSSPEFAIGAMAGQGVTVLGPEVGSVSPLYLQEEMVKQRFALNQRILRYGVDPKTCLRGRVAIIIDDGAATGLTLLAAIKEARRRQAKKIVCALPVCSHKLTATLKSQGIEVVSLLTVESLSSVGAYFEDFEPVSDAEVLEMVQRSKQRGSQVVDSSSVKGGEWHGPSAFASARASASLH